MSNSRKLLIAIDGPAGSGKSTTAKALAKRLNIPFIDTGAMYRAVTWKAMQEGIDFSDTKRLVEIAKKSKIVFKNVGARSPRPGRGNPAPTEQRVCLDGKDVTREIRLPELTKNVFHVAQEPLIRRELVAKQRALGQQSGGVMEGRDIGTVVFPDADYKFYFEADLKIRTKRRMKDLRAGTSPAPTLAEVQRDIQQRDRHDKTRSEGPLRCAKDAFRIDTTPLTIDETVDRILAIIQANPLKSNSFRKTFRPKTVR